jgi:hypothetical protein
VGEWDIKFAERQRAAYEKAKAQQRELVEQMELRARAAEAEAKLRAAKPEAKPAAPIGRRYAGDDELVAEGVKGIKSKRWPYNHQAAMDLAHRADGSATYASKVRRIEAKIAERRFED